MIIIAYLKKHELKCSNLESLLGSLSSKQDVEAHFNDLLNQTKDLQKKHSQNFTTLQSKVYNRSQRNKGESDLRTDSEKDFIHEIDYLSTQKDLATFMFLNSSRDPSEGWGQKEKTRLKNLTRYTVYSPNLELSADTQIKEKSMLVSLIQRYAAYKHYN